MEQNFTTNSPLVFKLSFKKPNKINNARNAAHIGYIATRPGVAKEEDVQMEKDSNMNYVKYTSERPGSHGLFDKNDSRVPSLKEVKKELSEHNGVVWRAIISLREDDAVRLGYVTRRAWEDTLRTIVPNIAEEMGIKESNLKWVAAFHEKEGHPHVHLVFWEKNPERTTGKINSDEKKNIKRDIAKGLFAEERTKLYSEKTVMRDLIRDIAKDDIAKAVNLIREIRNNEIDIKEKGLPRVIKDSEELGIDKATVLSDYIAKLSCIMPEKEKGRIALKYMPEDVKIATKYVARVLIESQIYKKPLEKHLNAVENLTREYTVDREKIHEARSNAYEDLLKRVSQIVLKGAAESRKDVIFTVDKEKMKLAAEAIKQADKKIDNTNEKKEIADKVVTVLKKLGKDNEQAEDLLKQWNDNENIGIDKTDIKEIVKNNGINEKTDIELNKHMVTTILKATAHTKDQVSEILKEKLNEVEKNINELIGKGVLSKNGERIELSENGKKCFWKDIKLNRIENEVYKLIEDNKEVSINDLLDEDKISKQLKKEAFKEKKFQFGKYDANIVFKYFDKGILEKETLELKIANKYKDEDKVLKEFDVITSRIDKLIENGYVNENGDKYEITEKGNVEAKIVSKQFQFTKYDAEVIFKYIEESNGEPNKIKENINNEYADPNAAKRQFKYITGRIKNNIKEGFLENKNGHVEITDKGKEKCFELMHPGKEKIEQIVKYFKYLGIVNQNEDGRIEVNKEYTGNKEQQNDIKISKDISILINKNKGFLKAEDVEHLKNDEINKALQDYEKVDTKYESLTDELKIKSVVKDTFTNMGRILFNAGLESEEVFNILSEFNSKTGMNFEDKMVKNIVDKTEKAYEEIRGWGRDSIFSKKQWNELFDRLGIKNTPEWSYNTNAKSNLVLKFKHNQKNWEVKNNFNSSPALNSICKSVWNLIERERIKSEVKAETLKREFADEKVNQRSKQSSLDYEQDYE